MNSPPRVPLSLNRSLDPPESSGSPTQPCEDSSIQNFHRGYARAMNMRASPKSETFAGGPVNGSRREELLVDYSQESVWGYQNSHRGYARAMNLRARHGPY